MAIPYYKYTGVCSGLILPWVKGFVVVGSAQVQVSQLDQILAHGEIWTKRHKPTIWKHGLLLQLWCHNITTKTSVILS